MRLSKHRRPTSAKINMTPMIDIVFLLIIFFITVSQVSEMNRERLTLPEQPGAEDQQPVILTVNVNREGMIIVSGAAYQLSELIALVGDELAQLNDDPDRLTVVLRADRRGASEAVNDVVKALARLQVRKIRFAVQVPG